MDGTAGAIRRTRHAGWIPWVVGGLWLLAIALTLGAMTFQPNDSAALYRFYRSLPGIADACGTFTLFARAIPPALALAGVGLTFLVPGPPRSAVPLRILGVALAIGLAFAVMQNAEIGSRLCIVD